MFSSFFQILFHLIISRKGSQGSEKLIYYQKNNDGVSLFRDRLKIKQIILPKKRKQSNKKVILILIIKINIFQLIFVLLNYINILSKFIMFFGRVVLFFVLMIDLLDFIFFMNKIYYLDYFWLCNYTLQQIVAYFKLRSSFLKASLKYINTISHITICSINLYSQNNKLKIIGVKFKTFVYFKIIQP